MFSSRRKSTIRVGMDAAVAVRRLVCGFIGDDSSYPTLITDLSMLRKESLEG